VAGASRTYALAGVTLFALALGIGASFAACTRDDLRFFRGERAAPTNASGRDRSTDTLIVGRAADVVGLDPARFAENESVEVCEQIFEHLVRLRADGQDVEPALATAWEVAEDGRTWTFHLRKGVTFHDGTPFDAEAVRFSFERQLDRNHPFRMPDFTYWDNNFASIVRAIEVIDPMTVKIYLFKPQASFLSLLSMFPVSIVSPTAVKKWGPAFAEHPVGTGPFQFVEWERGDRIQLQRFAGYWGDKARLAHIVFKNIPDARQRLVALEGGAIDVAYGILPEELQFVVLHPELELVRAPGMNVAYLAMNTQRPPWNDVRVRRAVNHAINKVPIVSLIYQGNAVPASGPVPPTLWSYDRDVMQYAYDPARARALLDEAAAAGVFDASQHYKLYAPATPRPYLPDPERMARALQRNLEDVGVHVEIVLLPFPEFPVAVEAGSHDLCLIGWTADIPDPDNFLYQLLSRDNAQEGAHARNLAFYRDANVSGLLQYAQETSDRAERERYYREAQERIAVDAPWVPIAHSALALGIRQDVQNLAIHPSSLVYYQTVWIKP
jgi:peptide/nickel transport system substrate-binding protein